MKKTLTALLFMSILLIGCSSFRSHSEQPYTSGFNLEQVMEDLRPLNLDQAFVPTEAIADYFRFYDLNPTGAQHFFGTAVSEGQTLVVHIFLPPEPRGTLYLMHGFLDHTGTLSKLIKAGLEHQYAVVSWDLPGHGLSSGARTDIGEFELSARQLSDIIGRSENHLPKPFHLIAHSTGCSISLEYIYHSPTRKFDGIVFLAPLIHHQHMGWGRFGYTIAKPFTSSFRRVDTISSSDQEYLDFVKSDPLQSSSLSLAYLGDLYRWVDEAKTYPAWPGSMLVIQGDQDDIVDWEYNLEFLSEKITYSEIRIIPGANHQLANEREDLRNEVFRMIFAYLAKAPEEASPVKPHKTYSKHG